MSERLPTPAAAVLSGKRRARPAIRRVLVPIDGSPASHGAIAMAIELCAALGAEARILHITDPGSPSRMRISSDAVTFQWESPRESAALVGAAVERCREAGVRAASQVLGRFESIPQEIIDTANDCDADLIIIGSTGHGAVASLLLGSVAWTVVRDARVPVLIAR